MIGIKAVGSLGVMILNMDKVLVKLKEHWIKYLSREHF